MLRKKLIEYYSRDDIKEAIFEISKNREIGVKYFDNFGRRPFILNYPSDVEILAKKGMTSLHYSVEIWEDPLLLENKKVKLEDLRIGFDLVVDIDFSYLPYSFVALKELINFLEGYNIKNFGIKYSGNLGFHLSLNWLSFPDKFKDKEMKNWFPDLPKIIIEFIFEKIKENIAKSILIEEGIFYDGEGAIKRIMEKFRYEEKLINKEIPISIKENEYSEKILKLKDIIEEKPELMKKITENITKNLINKYKDDEEELMKKLGKFLSYYVLVPKMDSMVVSNRHLIRMPYSYNEKSGLISVPLKLKEIRSLKLEEIKEFILKKAKINNVVVDDLFIDKVEKKINIYNLIEDAYNWFEERKKREVEERLFVPKYKEKRILTKKRKKKIEVEDFPPCIKNILEGLEDGKKRALFILMNFLFFAGYNIEEIEEIIWKWNEKNKEKLRESYIKSQLKWFKKLIEKGKYYYLPNCDNKDYYKDIGICKPDLICKKIKNPMSYVNFLGKTKK